MSTPFDVFLGPDPLHINRARLDHLATLGLDLRNKRVLEVGAGIGLHTGFFEERGCDILSTDGNEANVAEMKRRYPRRNIDLLNLDIPDDLTRLGSFDVVYCYGTLYHLQFPERTLSQLADICAGMILLETIVIPGNYPEVHPIVEPPVANQALFGLGCRPTRAWVMAALRRYFGNAYTTLDQPDYPDFIDDWSVISRDGNLRAVFVGSKQELTATGLTDELIIRHRGVPLPAKPELKSTTSNDYMAFLSEQMKTAAMDLAGKIASNTVSASKVADIREAAELLLRKIGARPEK